MADNLSPEIRRKNMQAIRSQNTIMENRVCSALWRRGLRFRRNVRNLPGKPDIAVKKYKVVVFLDSCFWHSCPQHGNAPATNMEYWSQKLHGNKARDQEVNAYYESKGWSILRVWEHDVKTDLQQTVDTIEQFIRKHERKSPKQGGTNHG
ncbi:very short patch repair endonuclease [Alicyclobacillus hesperidum]|uniref:Very short patch repair endonuclease n=1 Tax=Alicyclobacillus hesperidum TaxID=89784 RepID=A0A1H2X5G2_9BACL|nr:very short patch repair endonuclease [Alicyclobacillus hesperidum]GLV14742.1 very short patch repair endonuclease [Alicyclobacillus hesperidum]SDW88133.1 T/G mismatch-specific endonuclease [Alicyclobacillus hesperidum]